MRSRFLMLLRACAIFTAVAFCWVALAQSPPPAAPSAEVETLRALLPDQSHAMADVDYHFSSLWFAVQQANWPLADFYLSEVRSHLGWAVRIKPVRKLHDGRDLPLAPLLAAVDQGPLTVMKQTLDSKDRPAFETAYKATMAACYNCHAASEKPYLKLGMPAAPGARMIDFAPAR